MWALCDKGEFGWMDPKLLPDKEGRNLEPHEK